MTKDQAIALLNGMTMKELEKYVRSIAKKFGDKLKDPNRNYSKPIKPKLIDYAITHYETAIISDLSKDQKKTETETETETATDLETIEEINTDSDLITYGETTDMETDITDPFNGFKVWIQNEIKTISTNSVNEDKVLDIAKKAIDHAFKNQPKETVVINKAKETKVEIKTAHKIFPKLLKMATSPDVNVALVGAAGCGKTHIASQIAKALKMDFTSISMTAGTSEGQLTGWLLPVEENGRFTFVASKFLELYERGNAVILLDEMDASDANMLLIANQALANGGFYCATRNEKTYVKRGENVILIGAMNTWGNGADLQYCGRSDLDMASLDRFVFLPMDYDKDLEKKLIPNETLRLWADKIRKNIAKNKIERILSTRKLTAFNSLLNNADFTMSEIEETYFMGWSADEKSKAVA